MNEDVKKKRNLRKISRRQIEVMMSIHLRKHTFSQVRFLDLVGDLGISGSTLADHLDALAKRTLVQESPNRSYRFKNYETQIELTDLGRAKVAEFMGNFGISPNEPQRRAIVKIGEGFVSPSPNLMLRKPRSSGFSGAFNELIMQNPTEPVISSVGMYTELDSQLGIMASSPRPEDRELYLTLSRTQLNLPIRNGRIASIVIPTSLRQQISSVQLARTLEDSWHWFRTVNTNTIDRYLGESTSMGLIEFDGGTIRSLKPGATSTMAWLAEKTISTFKNAVPNIPKAAILTFRESFSYPTRDELVRPTSANVELPWAEHIYSQMGSKDQYRDIVGNAIDVLVDQARIIVEDKESGRLVPRTIIRRLSKAKDMEEAFRRLLKLAGEQNLAAALLLTITANPGMTSERLFDVLAGDKWIFVKKGELDDAIRQLIGLGLIHTAGGEHGIKLYAFTHVPYFVQQNEPKKSEINALLKGVNPSLLTRIGETMNSQEDRTSLTETLTKLLRNHIVDFDTIESEFGKSFSRKFLMLADYLTPFTTVTKDASAIEVSKAELSSVVLDVAQYSLLTSNDALSQYATLLSDIVVKDASFKNRLIESAKSIESMFMDRGMKM